MTKERLDQLLVDLQLVSSCHIAQGMIRAGRVRVNGQLVDKPTETFDPLKVQIHMAPLPLYVSRGGEKLIGALTDFPIVTQGRICLDGGISTGGFTDCLLQAGAAKVYGIDVGYGQVAWKLQTDPRVVLKERTNLRHLTAAKLYGPEEPKPDLATVDISFISLAKVLPALYDLLVAPRELLLLVKPQFEAARAEVGKNGVVRSPEVHQSVLEKVWQASQPFGWKFQGVTYSPVRGPQGNIEYWLWLSCAGEEVEEPMKEPSAQFKAVVEQAHGVL
jgi:23S rRNA (cytidine1920-2'-O)/16S rRNA (cytidine1409-2'-O)-methyltransferase